VSLDNTVILNVIVVIGGRLRYRHARHARKQAERKADAFLKKLNDEAMSRRNESSTNVQINDLVKALIMSEPCLFHNSSDNLMSVTENKEENNG